MIRTEEDAIRFMASVKFALRYNATPGLPLASMYAAAKDQRIATDLTNALLGSGEVIETNVIANRLVLVHRDMVPNLYVLRKRNRASQLSDAARKALALIESDGSASSGDIRRYLGVYGRKRPDPGDLALSELQREMLIDRGAAADAPQRGMPYLSREGYPYRCFERAHADIIRQAGGIQISDAIRSIVRAIGPVPSKKTASMFKLCFSEEELKRCAQDC